MARASTWLALGVLLATGAAGCLGGDGGPADDAGRGDGWDPTAPMELAIVHSRLLAFADGRGVVLGEIENQGDTRVDLVHIVVQLFDHNGTEMRATPGTVRRPMLPAGERAPFEAAIANTTGVASHGIQPLGHAFPTAPGWTQDVEPIGELEGNEDGASGTWRFTGEVRNEGAASMRAGVAAAVFYNATGAPVAVANAEVPALAPGASAAIVFERVDAHGEAIASHRVWIDTLPET